MKRWRRAGLSGKFSQESIVAGRVGSDVNPDGILLIGLFIPIIFPYSEYTVALHLPTALDIRSDHMPSFG